ncbi:hypothetical protein KAJ83_04545 [Marivibrio halodurans]|uniref:Uncharacterized protein n=1 Tax=Marivibrio halodurans TaxID=2039722 RepID=A0A8J7RXC0_9PROT|nr:hypothetical protein [Marivibrio halodurans]MBP5856265.1 hypothetical protein [Marivibrio halodurans]
MPRVKSVKTTFTAGEVGVHLMGRTDLRAYANGAACLRNVIVQPTGGVRRRAGLRHVAGVAGGGRLIAFEFNTEQTYLLVLTHGAITVYNEAETAVATLATPYAAGDIPSIAWTQSADTLLLMHPNHAPRQFIRTGATSFELIGWSFEQGDSGRLHQPHHKFAKADVVLQPTGTANAIGVAASAPVFTAAHMNARFRIGGKEIRITGISSATQASASVMEELDGTAATTDWTEQAFSAARGYPICGVFHQDRLVIGGSREAPNRLWFSKASDLFNFDLGTGEDDEAIEFAILSDQVNAIRAVFSGQHLQVLTSGAEWMVQGEPLTPTNLDLKRQTRVGSPIDRYVPPRSVDLGTLFVSRDGRTLREFLFADSEQAYEAKELTTLVRHMVDHPVDLDYHPEERLVYVVMGDGAIGAVTQYRQEAVTAWSRIDTNGAFRSVAVSGGRVYVLVERDGSMRLERFDPSLMTDGAFTLVAGTPRAPWGAGQGGDSTLAPLEGVEAAIRADGWVHAPARVTGGVLTLTEAVSAVEVGRPYTHEVAPLPVFVKEAGAGPGQAVRLVRALFRLEATQALHVDTGRGPVPVPFARRDGLSGPVAPAPATVDKLVRAIGWTKGEGTPLWRVEQATPVPCTILSVMTEISANG